MFDLVANRNRFALVDLFTGVVADIVGLSVVSTDITGPRGFMKKYGGTLVENSQKGIENGFEMLYNNEVKRLNVDYDEYNREALEEFESVI